MVWCFIYNVFCEVKVISSSEEDTVRANASHRES